LQFLPQLLASSGGSARLQRDQRPGIVVGIASAI
jgi:hypothetical protein